MEMPRTNVPARSSQATAHWADPDTLEQVGYSPGDTWFGYTLTEHSSPFGFSDDRHVVTIAGSRAGKGTGAIIPNLCEYPGSLICIDPKGENATITAARRGKGSAYAEGMGQKVWVLDPFNAAHVDDDMRGCFNPLDCIDPESDDAIDDAGAIAEALIVPSDSKDRHWDESARDFLKGLILYVVVTEPPERRHLPRVRELLMLGDREGAEEKERETGESVHPFTLLMMLMGRQDAFHGVIAGAAALLMDVGDRERGSMISTARRNTSFIDSPGMRRMLTESSFSLDDLKQAQEGLSLYLCLPARRLETHGRWLRTVVMLALGHMERLGQRPATGHPVLFLLDEFATLGHMESLEKAAAFIAGYGVKLWIVLQDLNQLRANYKDRWETFLGNAGIIQFFGNADKTTLEYISKRLGEMEMRQETTGSSESENESQSTSHSDSTSLSSGNSDSRNWGYNSSGGSSGRNFSQGETFGKSYGSNYGTSRSISRNETITVAPLLRPDEIAKAFARGTGRQLLLIPGAPPVVLGQTIYFKDPYFIGKFDPHPDHPDSAPPTLEAMKAEQLEIEYEDRRIEEARLARLEQDRRKRRKRVMIWGGIFIFIALGQAGRWMVTASAIPVEQISLRVEELRLRPSQAGGHWVVIHSVIENNSDRTLRELQVKWRGRDCLTQVSSAKWTDCTAFDLPELTNNWVIPPAGKRKMISPYDGIKGLRGTVFVDAEILSASE